MSRAFAERAEGLARRCKGHAALAGAGAAVALLASPLAGRGVDGGPTTTLLVFSIAAGLAALALAGLLLFDAALFRLMAGYPDEDAAGQAVEDFLSRAGLKAKPTMTRGVEARGQGAARLSRRALLLVALNWCLLAAAWLAG